MSLGYAYYAPNETVYHEGITVKKWQEEYTETWRTNSLPDYSGYTYDAVWVYAFALDKLLDEDKTHYADLHSENTNR